MNSFKNFTLGLATIVALAGAAKAEDIVLMQPREVIVTVPVPYQVQIPRSRIVQDPTSSTGYGVYNWTETGTAYRSERRRVVQNVPVTYRSVEPRRNCRFGEALGAIVSAPFEFAADVSTAVTGREPTYREQQHYRGEAQFQSFSDPRINNPNFNRDMHMMNPQQHNQNQPPTVINNFYGPVQQR